MNLTRLQTFVEVVRRGTFAGAADALSFTPSAVSQQMAKLEGEAGTVLLTREGAGVQLTEAGRLLHEHALGIVEAVRRARAGLDALQVEQVKRLRIAACPVATATVVPRALRVLRRRLPGAELLLEETAAEDALRDGRADVGVWLSSGSSADLIDTVLADGPLLVALPADHSLTSMHELDDVALAPTPRISGVGSLAGRLALVAAGEGYDLVPALAAELVPAGVALRPIAGAPTWELRAARPVDAVPSVGTLAAIEALRGAARRERRSPPATATLVAHG
ncbi:MAG TPA: LysR family transcriptional regulator [Solirubrobacteraceae bacterium]|jgi:DNA-binding transcriptional LysR family regulator|nr:LysR family transcriptional regulator [Solirubrobacteraceae bacterium]